MIEELFSLITLYKLFWSLWHKLCDKSFVSLVCTTQLQPQAPLLWWCIMRFTGGVKSSKVKILPVQILGYWRFWDYIRVGSYRRWLGGSYDDSYNYVTVQIYSSHSNILHTPHHPRNIDEHLQNRALISTFTHTFIFTHTRLKVQPNLVNVFDIIGATWAP